MEEDKVVSIIMGNTFLAIGGNLIDLAAEELIIRINVTTRPKVQRYGPKSFL